MFGPMWSGYKMRVRCANEACPKPADTAVPVYAAGDGVLMAPRLVCAGCAHDVQEVPADA